MLDSMAIAGMHRSGTSLAASIAAAAGVDMGDRLLRADRSNPRGYFEDLGFLSLQQRMLADATLPNDGGHRDWGWTESERLDRERFQPYRDEARALIGAHRGAGRPWGSHCGVPALVWPSPR